MKPLKILLCYFHATKLFLLLTLIAFIIPYTAVQIAFSILRCALHSYSHWLPAMSTMTPDKASSHEKAADLISNNSDDSTTGLEASTFFGAHPSKCSNSKPPTETESPSLISSNNRKKIESVKKEKKMDVHSQSPRSSLCPTPATSETTTTTSPSSTKLSGEEVSSLKSSRNQGNCNSTWTKSQCHYLLSVVISPFDWELNIILDGPHSKMVKLNSNTVNGAKFCINYSTYWC